MTSIVLAGGRSLRLGRNKVLETLGGKTLIERVVDCLAPISDQIIIATTPEQRLPQFHHKIETVFDIYPGKGALSGVHSGLASSRSFHSLVVGADMPFLNIKLLSYMRDIASDFDVVVPRLGDLFEPLHAVYSKRCIKPIEDQIKSGKHNVFGFYSQVLVRYVEEAELNQFDPKHLSFFNINTQADLERAREIVERQQDTQRVIGS